MYFILLSSLLNFVDQIRKRNSLKLTKRTIFCWR